MKAIISTHSFVDVITNSSSELFICETKKSVDAVKQVVEKLAEMYNEQSDMSERGCSSISIDRLWKDVFKEPFASPYSFNLEDYPNIDEYRKVFGDERSYGYFRGMDKSVHPIKSTCDLQLAVWLEKNPAPKWPKNTDYKSKEYKKYEKENAAHRKLKDEFCATCYAPWAKLNRDTQLEMYEWAFELNNVHISLLGNFEAHPGEYISFSFDNYQLDYGNELNATGATLLMHLIDEALAWNYSFKKGDVFLHSASDNTIPYEFWPMIERTFSCQRRHLG